VDWQAETRRSIRACVVKFFEWAHKQGRIPANPAADMERVKRQSGMPQPAPDQAWRDALAAATPREAIKLRLAAEAGVRRAEVAQV